MNLEWSGFVYAVTTFTTIALGHILVLRLHPVVGTRLGFPLIALGVLILILSGLTADNLFSGILGIVGVTTFWNGIEFFRQQKRVQREKQSHEIPKPN